MRILQNVTQDEMNSYMRQPTAKKLHNRIMNDGVFIRPGDRAAAEAYANGKHGSPGGTVPSDKTEISDEGRSLQERSASQTVKKKSMNWLNVTGNGNGKFKAHFSGRGEIASILELGYIMVDNKKVSLSKHQLKELSAIGKSLEKDQQAVTNRMMMEQQLASARQQSDSWKKAAQQQSRILATAMRIMKGRHVSEEDEKELAEGSPDLYRLAKSAGALEKIRESQREREEDQKISESNDREREWENTPKDYSTPPRSAYPSYEAQVSVDMSGEEPQITGMGEVTIPPSE